MNGGEEETSYPRLPRVRGGCGDSTEPRQPVRRTSWTTGSGGEAEAFVLHHLRGQILVHGTHTPRGGDPRRSDACGLRATSRRGHAVRGGGGQSRTRSSRARTRCRGGSGRRTSRRPRQGPRRRSSENTPARCCRTCARTSWRRLSTTSCSGIASRCWSSCTHPSASVGRWSDPRIRPRPWHTPRR